VPDVGTFLLLAAGGLGAGLSGTMAGLASLFSYPALLAAGLPAVAANVTNTVALTFTSVGAAAGSRPELSGQWPTVRRFALLTAIGGALGAGLLLITPPGAFEKVVPVLIAGAGAVLLFQPQIRAAVLRKAGENHHSGPLVLAGILAVGVYGGYFGAAAGVMLLALLLIALPVSLLQGNAIKNVLLGVSNAIAAIGFALFAPVDWWAVLPLAAGALIGARLGPVLARHLPPDEGTATLLDRSLPGSHVVRCGGDRLGPGGSAGPGIGTHRTGNPHSPWRKRRLTIGRGGLGLVLHTRRLRLARHPACVVGRACRERRIGGAPPQPVEGTGERGRRELADDRRRGCVPDGRGVDGGDVLAHPLDGQQRRGEGRQRRPRRLVGRDPIARRGLGARSGSPDQQPVHRRCGGGG
jgi:uncharacterized protein